jgi:hypothetical protein
MAEMGHFTFVSMYLQLAMTTVEYSLAESSLPEPISRHSNTYML